MGFIHPCVVVLNASVILQKCRVHEKYKVEQQAHKCRIGECHHMAMCENRIYCGPQVQYAAYKHIADIPSCVSYLLNTFRLFQAFIGCAEFFSACQAFFSYTEPFSTLPSVFLLCYVVFLLCRVFFCFAVYFMA